MCRNTVLGFDSLFLMMQLSTLSYIWVWLYEPKADEGSCAFLCFLFMSLRDRFPLPRRITCVSFWVSKTHTFEAINLAHICSAVQHKCACLSTYSSDIGFFVSDDGFFYLAYVWDAYANLKLTKVSVLLCASYAWSYCTACRR